MTSSRSRSLSIGFSDGAMIPSDQARNSRSVSLALSRQSMDAPEGGKPRGHDRILLDEQVQLLKSLDDRQREDLAQHLLLTFHLNQYFKQGLQNPSRESEVIGEPVGNGGEKNETPKSNKVSLQRRWRAWPLPLRQTPRLEQGSSTSDSLRGCLTATLLRFASNKMGSREEKETFSADDDYSARFCAPASEHIMASLDRLLVGLYRSKEGYAANEAVQNIDTLFRKGRHRFGKRKGDKGSLQNNLNSDDRMTKKQRTGADSSVPSTTQAYRQGSQRLLSATDVFQHAMLQLFPLKVLQRGSERLESLFQLPPGGDYQHNKYLTLIEGKQASAQFGSLKEEKDSNDADWMESTSRMFLKTDAERVQVGEKHVSRAMWEAYDEHKAQKTEAGCFDRDGFLEEIPGPGRTNENRRRNYKAKKRRELEIHPA
ncbi:hypothetical protein ABW20_dc0107250 [Dactylellina cionopaga]|nr:hypothetical protein ABW20_dc0107250 [Dactylellina cionopaga]